MSDVHAFVGHSFTDDDKPVVDTFLELFRTFRETGKNFTWDHALKAESLELAAKVLQKMEGKNTFIGICTRKEEVIKAKQCRFFWRWRIFEKHEIEWKTSDWIIQEIGLAIGRNLKLVLFVEEGVRRPGGLQGNVEYISFNRANPADSFSKFMEMFSSLAPPVTFSMATAPANEPAPDANTDAESEPSFDFWTPEPQWDREDYRRALFFAILRNNENKISKLNDAYRATSEAQSPEIIASWVAFCELIRILHGKGGNFSILKQLAENSRNSDVLNSLARAYSHFQNFDEAAAVYQSAASFAHTKAEQLENLKRAALSYQAKGDLPAALSVADKIREEFSDGPEIELSSLKALREIYEEAQLHSLEIGLMERILEIDPGDPSVRFSLAYKHSEKGSKELSLYHYLLIGPQERSPIAWNNLGVAYTGFKLPVSAVRAFRRAKDMNETLAMSNLAYRFMQAGFLEEASAECAEARVLPNHHPNVNAALSRIDQIPKEEAQQETELCNKARPCSEFMRQFGRALSRPIAFRVGGSWKHPKCDELIAEVNGSQFRAVGSYDRPPNALVAAMRGRPTGLGVPQTRERVMLTYQGALYGSALTCIIEEDDGQPTAPSLLNLSNTTEALMYLSADGTQLQVMENPFSATPKFYILLRRALEE